jgi:preprotein translocase subunit SecA/predicted negative regulator of RcsB-dependent stress response
VGEGTLPPRGEAYEVEKGHVLVGKDHNGMLRGSRRYERGLRQAIEAKEGLAISPVATIFARVAVRDYFLMYDNLAGLTATAVLAAEEFAEVYKLGVVQIPGSALVASVDRELTFKTSRAKVAALARDAVARHGRGQPVLIAGVSAEDFAPLAWLLDDAGVRYMLLRSSADRDVAAVMADAGRRGAVTVLCEAVFRGYGVSLGGLDSDPQEREDLIKAGGLAVLGCGWNRSRRADDWLRSLAARHGGPGECLIYHSLEDLLMRKFDSKINRRLAGAIRYPIVDDRSTLAGKLRSHLINDAQRHAEANAAKIRSMLRPIEEVADSQRRQVYAMRRAILQTPDINEQARHTVDKIIRPRIPPHNRPTAPSERDTAYAFRERHTDDAFPSDNKTREAFLSAIDQQWREHLADLDGLFDRVMLDYDLLDNPTAEFRFQASQLYAKMLGRIKAEITGRRSGIYEQVFASGQAEMPPQAVIDLGNVLAEQGDVDGARAAYQRAIDSGHADYSPEAMLDLGVLLHEQGDSEGARQAYQQAIDSGHPDFAPAGRLATGTLLDDQGNLEEARATYRSLIESGHADYGPMAALNLGDLLADQGDTEGARKAYRLAVESSHPEVAGTAARRLQSPTNPEEAT